jgi:hypothetical protein
MKARPLPPREQLRELFIYNFESGVITLANGRPPYQSPRGYLQFRIGRRLIYAHRLIWKLAHDQEPPQIDHKNGIKNDNRLLNLRPATPTINNRNSPKRADNTSGTCGVSIHKASGKWRSFITIAGKFQHLGLFEQRREAEKARLNAQRLHGFSERHGL